jgi:hypothetical protein
VNTSAAGSQSISDSSLAARYPGRTTVVHDWSDVGFDNGSSALTSSSRFFQNASDGKSYGADVRAIVQAQAGRRSDGCGSPAVPRAGRP